LQTKFDIVHPCGPAGLNEHKENNDFFKVFPSPARDLLNIEYASELESNCEFQLVQLDGTIVKTSNFVGHSSLDISQLASGSYIARIRVENKEYSKMIVIE
jgi:hypothetical protein